MEQIKNNIIGKSVVAVGNFDGVHKGHRLIFSKTTEIAATEKLSSVALTFYPHPRNFFDSSHPVKIITDDEYKKELILSLGIDNVVLHHFNNDFASLNCSKFVSFLINSLNCKHIVCGDNFRFGDQAKYGIEELDSECRRVGLQLHTVGIDTRFSSSSIREGITRGDMKSASDMMGRYFSFSSVVLNGKKIGSKIGFPTVNQKLPPDFITPKYGVYSGFTSFDSIRHKCIVNIGCRPTVNNDSTDVDCETHIFNYSGDLYGRELRISLTDFIRPEIKFDNLSQLKEQIKRDCYFVIQNTI